MPSSRKPLTLSCSLDDVAAGLDLEPDLVAAMADAGELLVYLERVPTPRGSGVPVTTSGDWPEGVDPPARPETVEEPEPEPAAAGASNSPSRSSRKTSNS